MARKRKHTLVIHRNLDKDKVWGWAHIGDNIIEIDEKLYGYRYLLYLLHEHYHLIHPDWSETRIKKECSATARFLWQNQIRWVDLK